MNPDDVTLSEWQIFRFEETWEKDGEKIKSTRYGGEDKFSGLSGESEREDFTFDGLDSPQAMEDAGWVLRGVDREIVELIPGDTYFSMAKDIVALKPEERTVEHVRGMLKKMIHIQKYELYNRVYQHLKHELSDHSKAFFKAKQDTHRDLARLDVDKLGAGLTS